jgi:hypothetical protein
MLRVTLLMKTSREVAGSAAALKSSAVVYMVDFLSFVW